MYTFFLLVSFHRHSGQILSLQSSSKARPALPRTVSSEHFPTASSPRTLDKKIG